MDHAVVGGQHTDAMGERVDHHGADIPTIVEHVAHYLPTQAPIHAFVHHNTLHAFEDLPFHEAIAKASELFGAEPYASETMFRQALASGRIQSRDLEACIEPANDRNSRPLFAGGPSRRQLRLRRLHHLFTVPRGPALRWLLSETDFRKALHEEVSSERQNALSTQAQRRFGEVKAERRVRHMLNELWDHLLSVTPSREHVHRGIRRRDDLVRHGGADIDVWVQPLLIRLTAAYLDQGLAYWSMPSREQGYLHAFRDLYSRMAGPPDRWLSGLAETLRQQARQQWTAEQTIVWALQSMQINEEHHEQCILETLLSLRGWAGMMRQFEIEPEKAPVRALPARLIDYLAVHLLLDVFATKTALVDLLGPNNTFAALDSTLAASHASAASPNLELTYEAFVLAQLCDVDLALFEDRRVASIFMDEVASFDDLARRRALQDAYERRHRIDFLDALSVHVSRHDSPSAKPAFQAVFCIDDREESMRRHLEEVAPNCETFGYPGFFGVAMKYQGAHDVRARALCPVVMKPTHFVSETGATQKRHVRARVEHHMQLGSATLVRGFLMALMGLLATVPLVLAVLFPRAFRFKKGLAVPAIDEHTTLHFERTGDEIREGLPAGYTTVEMAKVVKKLLVETGLQNSYSDLVLLIGHGSTSINNPHVAAYGCGATAGGCGGPNARVLASMANHAGVRSELRDEGISIPDSTWFVGGVHDTCTDDILFYDEDRVPAQLQARMKEIHRWMNVATKNNAHERCRLFGVVPLTITPEAAKAVGERRSVDLSEARPEYNHAKNSLCIVGQRKWTRGLFMDQRAFLVSYDPAADADGSYLLSVLRGSVPVGVGINLEYFFSEVENRIYGAGSKLPHNITGLFAVMDGHASDLRTGLYHQMIELHEPVRMVAVIEATPETLVSILERDANIARLVTHEWLTVASWNPQDNELKVFSDGKFEKYIPESLDLPVVDCSRRAYEGTREPVACCQIQPNGGGNA